MGEGGEREMVGQVVGVWGGGGGVWGGGGGVLDTKNDRAFGAQTFKKQSL